MRGRVAAIVRRLSAHSSDRWLIAWAIGYAAIGAASLLVPLYALSRGGDAFVVGAIEATAGLAGVPGALVWGRLADRSGRRRAFVIASLVGTGCSLLAFPFVESILVIILLNTVLWFMVAAASPVVTLFIIERASERDWETRIGVLNAYQRYGWVGGLVVGTGWIGTVSLQYSPIAAQRSFFLVCAAGALAATPLSFYWLPPEASTSGRRLARSSQAVYRLVAGSGRYVKAIPFVPTRAVFALQRVGRTGVFERFSPTLRRYMLVAFFFSCASAIFFGPVPAFLVSLNYSSAAVFGFFILASLASAVVFVPVGKRAGRVHAKRLQLQALGVRVLLFPAIGMVVLLPWFDLQSASIAVAFLLLGFTWAAIAVTGAGLVSRSAPARLRGEALGIYTAVSGFGGGVGGLLGGYVAARLGYQVAFVLAGILVLVSIALLVSIRFTTQSTDAHPMAR